MTTKLRTALPYTKNTTDFKPVCLELNRTHMMFFNQLPHNFTKSKPVESDHKWSFTDYFHNGLTDSQSTFLLTFFLYGWQLDNCSFGHLRMGHTCDHLFSPSPHPPTSLSNLVVIHFYFPGFPRLRISFELIIAFLDVNQVLLLILKYHRHLNNLKRLHLVSKLISFQSG